MIIFGMVVLALMYYAIKEKTLTGWAKWVVSAALFIGAVIGIFISHNRGEKYFLWCLTGAFFYYSLFELLKRVTLSRRENYIPPNANASEENNLLTDEEEVDVNKIVLIALFVWILVGILIIRKI